MHPCNFTSNGDGDTTYRGNTENISMCKWSYKPVTITNVLELFQLNTGCSLSFSGM